MQAQISPGPGPCLTAVRRSRRPHIEAVLAPHPHREAVRQQTSYRTPSTGGLLRGVLGLASFSSWWPGTTAKPEAEQAADVMADAAERVVAVRCARLRGVWSRWSPLAC